MIALRIRVTLAFALASALVLLGLGLFLHARLESELDSSLRTGLRQRLGDLTALARDGQADGLGRSHLVDRGDDVAQVLDAGGRVVAAAPGFERAPLLTAAERRRAQTHTVSGEAPAPDDDGRIELLAAAAGTNVAVVGASLEDRDEALASLDGLLWIALPVALLLAAGSGYVVAGSAVRPIEAAFARERAFVADASHELRTPLARLKAELELAARKGRSAGELEDAVRSAADETDRLVLLAEDLLVLARSDQGKLPLRRERIDVADLLDETRRRFAPEAAVEVPAGLTLVGDRLRLQQALANLIDNARRHGEGSVRLRAEQDGDGVGLHVHDDGEGVPAELRERAFERFTRGDRVRDPDGGAGLGLAIVAAVAEAHGGRSGIAEGPASDVWMKLPA